MALVGEERQLASLTAWTDARGYLQLAQARSTVAAGRVVTALAVWGAAKAALQRADQAEAAAARTVDLYQEALYELGVAEYTGQTAQSGTDLLAAEREVVVVQFGEVAADDTTDGLSRAQAVWAACRLRVRAARALVAVNWGRVLAARHAFAIAQGQVWRSHTALLEARRWATVAGKAPAQPVAALAKLEGSLVPRSQVATLYGLISLNADGYPLGASGPQIAIAGLANPVVGGAGLPSPPATASATATGVTSTTSGAAPATTAIASPSAPATAAASATTAVAHPAGVTTTSLSPAAKALAAIRARTIAADLAKTGPSILGPALLSGAQIEGWFASTGAVANTTVPIDTVIGDYMKAGRMTGVRADVAFAQSVVETGYFSFPTDGQDPAKYNNFAGIGACDSCKHGFRFPSAMDGALAQQDLLSNYATPSEMESGPEGPGDDLGVSGCCQTWMGLSGVWATNPNYGFAILSVYKEMLAWALQNELQKVGLVPAPPSTPAASTAATEASQDETVTSTTEVSHN